MIESSFAANVLGDVESVENWKSLAPYGYPDYAISDMGRIRCDVDRQGYKAPFFPSTGLRSGRPTVTLRDSTMRQHSRRIDELVLEAFCGPRPGDNWEASTINNDRQDVRADNLSWTEGLPKRQSTKRIRRTKKTKRTSLAKVPAEIKHGHWLGIGNVMVSIQPNSVVELTVADATDHHAIPANELDDVIRVLQAAKAIIEG